MIFSAYISLKYGAGQLGQYIEWLQSVFDLSGDVRSQLWDKHQIYMSVWLLCWRDWL